MTAPQSPSVSNSNAHGTALQPVLRFHTSHGEHVCLSEDRIIARRVASYFKGLAFSARPIRPNETVYLQVIESSVSGRGGALRIGFTSVNPSSYSDSLPSWLEEPLPGILTNQLGYWSKDLDEFGSLDVGVVLAFYYTPSGTVMLKVNDTDKGVFLSGIDVRSHLWVMVDIYGKTTAVQFFDPRGALNSNPMLNSRDRSAARLFSRHSTGGAIVIMDTNIVVRSEADLLALMAALNLNGAPLLLSQTLPPIPMTSVMANFPPPPPPPCHCLQHAFQSITPRPCIQGINMRMRPGWGVPVQSGYVISPRPIMPCVPPRPTHFLGGMMGEPIYPVSVRVTQPRPQQLLRPVPVQQQPRANQIYQMGSAQLPAPVLTSDTLEAGNRSPQCQSATIPGRDCIICYAKPVDCVLYSCGHMYFCYDCALMLSDTTGLCPICRAPILDVIRTYSP